jgi:diacylglycerol O-acyltransferase
MKVKLSLVDKLFFFFESDASPKHVSAYMHFSLPEGENQKFVIDLSKKLKGYSKAEAPFNQRIKTLFKIPTRYQTVDVLDMDYHIKNHQVNNIDDASEVDELVTKIHQDRLDPGKPLWQVHIIYSKDGSRFTLFKKIHHAYGDGIAILSWLMAAFSKKDTSALKPFWSIKHKENTEKKSYSPISLVKNLLAGLKYTKDILILISNHILRSIKPNRTDNAVAFSGHKSILTGKITPERAMTTIALPLDRLKQANKLTRTTVTDFMLTVIDIATHRFLKDYGDDKIERSLICQMPVSLRRPGDESSGNQIAIALVRMAHGQVDPYNRLRQVVNSNFLVKQESEIYSPTAYTHMSILLQSCSLLADLLHVADSVPPLGNMLVSNFPGPTIPLYFGACKVESMYPVSTLVPGSGLNITMVSYNGQLNLGLLCCSNKIDSIEPLKTYILEAFDLLIESINDPSLTINDLGQRSKNASGKTVENLDQHSTTRLAKSVELAEKLELAKSIELAKRTELEKNDELKKREYS